MHVSILSIIFMFISAVIQIGLPVCLFFYFRKKFNAKVMPALFGMLGFILFAMILEGAIHSAVFKAFPLREKPVIYIIYGTLMAGIFEETARFTAFNILKNRYGGIGTGLSYGVGHGGIESILLAGISTIAAVFTSVIINTGNAAIITSSLQGDALAAINMQFDVLVSTAPYMFLISGFERLMAVCIQISLSVIVFCSVYNKKLFLFPLAILLHAIIDISAAAYQAGALKSIFLVEGLVLISAIGLSFCAKYVYKKTCCPAEPDSTDGANSEKN